MNSTAPTVAPLERLPSGIPGLDTVLRGGFFRSGVYIVHGMPGSGKTILANQLCFSHVASGGRAVYVTLLSESHARMLQHLRGMSFFDESVIPGRLSYISAFHELESDGRKGLTAVMRREMRTRGVSVLVLDGLVAAAETAETDRELKKFIHDVQTIAGLHNCTVFLLTSGSAQRINAEHTMVDGLIELQDQLFDARAERAIQVRKFRGAGSLRGKHTLRISDEGVQVFPRTELLYGNTPYDGNGGTALSTGVPSLDGMIRAGGLPDSSATVVVGSTGTGKTTLGLHFLSCSSPQEPGLLFGFFESPERVELKARAFGMDFRALQANGALTLIWHSQGEHMLDQLAHRLVDEVTALKARRVVIDGLSGFFESAVYPERTTRFFSCLTNELRKRGATLLMTMETRDAVTNTINAQYGVSGFVDNLVFLRFVESGGRMQRLLSIVKMRDSDYDHGVHTLGITSSGMHVAGLLASGGDVIPTSHIHRDA
jgi:circadian clock protein KaiC